MLARNRRSNRALPAFLLVALLGAAAPAFAQTRLTCSGTVRESGSRLPLAGATVWVPALGLGTTTNPDGTFALSLPAADSLTLTVSMVGYEPQRKAISFSEKKPLTLELTAGTTLTGVTVSGAKARLGDATALSRIAISGDLIRQVPALLGEKDALKVIQLLPGVQKGSEGNAGVYVRGGGPDQNLILLDGATVYNASHLFGFFSVFNGDALQGVSLTKGGFPAQYGGRLSSVIDVTTRTGNRDRLRTEGSVGIIASRLTMDGPLGRRVSVLVSGRYSYYGLLTQQLMKNSGSGGPTNANFYDLNAKLLFDFGAKNQVTFSGYTGHDQFVGNRAANAASLQAGLGWGNTVGSLTWEHRFSEKLFANTAAQYSGYQLRVTNQDALTVGKTTQVYELEYASRIQDVTLKSDWDAFFGNHHLRFGAQATQHRFLPSAVVRATAEAGSLLNNGQEIKALESGMYAEDSWKPTARLHLVAGLRVSDYRQNGTRYTRPEPRTSLAYSLPTDWAVKASYAKMNQYVHLLSNSGIGLPTDLWVPTTDRVQPQQSEQIAVGVTKEFSKKKLMFSVEAYRKTMSNLLSYREGSSFLLPTDGKAARWEDDVTAGRGWSSGVEVLLQKRAGRFTGWAGYTWSMTRWQFEELNGGQPFFPRYDRRHDVSLVGSYALTPGIRLAGTWVYGTGQALTVPVARYRATVNNPAANPDAPFGTSLTTREFSGKNSFRAEPYHRLDLSVQFVRQRGGGRERVWEVSVYNAYNRRNPFFYAMEGKTDPATKLTRTVMYRYSLFSLIPSVSYSFKI